MKITFALIAIVVGLVLVNPFGADTIRQKGQVQAKGITIAYESFGKLDRETWKLLTRFRHSLRHRMHFKHSSWIEVVFPPGGHNSDGAACSDCICKP
jgi:hypothetical protein